MLPYLPVITILPESFLEEKTYQRYNIIWCPSQLLLILNTRWQIIECITWHFVFSKRKLQLVFRSYYVFSSRKYKIKEIQLLWELKYRIIIKVVKQSHLAKTEASQATTVWLKPDYFFFILLITNNCVFALKSFV